MEKKQLEKRYGLFTAICMVVGIVIGSGVFFKAQDLRNSSFHIFGFGVAHRLDGNGCTAANKAISDFNLFCHSASP